MTLAALDTLAPAPDLTSQESQHLGGQVFTRLAGGKIANEHVHRLLAACKAFLTSAESKAAEGQEEWTDARRAWKTTVHALSDAALRLDIQELTELTDEHRELVLDPDRNSVFNYSRPRQLLKAYLKTHPDVRPPNMMGGTLLYHARPGCRHKSDGRFSGVGCAKCPGWFCY